MTSVRVTNAGIEHDRSFALIKYTENTPEDVSTHLTIKTTSQLCLFRQALDANLSTLIITFTRHGKSIETINIPLNPSAEDLGPTTFAIDIFGSRAIGFDMGPEIASFFSRHLEQPARLIYIGTNGCRAIPAPSLIPQRSSRFPWLFKDEAHEQQIRFADAAPLLITTTASEEDARARLPEGHHKEDIILRFRPNVHIDVSDQPGFQPYEEDTWKKVNISSKADAKEVDLDIVFRTVRCQSLNVDFETGGLVPNERQLYKLLAKDRRVNPAFPMKPCFGVYAFAAPSGTVLSVGDKIEVIALQS